MPTFHIEMFEGRSVEQKRKLAEEVTRATRELLSCIPGAVGIIIIDTRRENWATGGVLWSEQK